MAEGAMKMEISLEKYKEMQDRIGELEKENKELREAVSCPPHWMHWISVKDRLPSHETMVIVYSELCGIGLAFIDNRDEKWCGDCHDEDVLYWMPLPEPPEVEDGNGE